MSSWLGGILKDPDKRAILSWIGGGAVVVAGGIWTVVTFVVEHKDAQDKKSGTTVTLPGQGVASGHDTNIGGNVNIGFDEKRAQKNFDELKDKIDSLTVQLNALRQTPASPGARQALGDAVGSITQGAEKGDTRLKQALVLLKDNKVAEATQLLNTVAKDKTAQAEQAATHAETDRKEAAIAYRNLGAIAGLRDPKAAREAYAKAVALDPDNAEGLYWDGWLQLSANNLDAAEKSYRALLRLASKGASEREIFWAGAGLGDIAVARGDLNAALAAYGEARSEMDRLATSDPGNAGWQRDLSMSYNSVGDVQVARGDLKAALKSYSDSLAIISRLATSDPGNAGWQRDLSVSYNKVGEVQEAQGDLTAALKSELDSLAIAERLATSDPGNAHRQHDLAVTQGMVGIVQQAQGDLQAALKSDQVGLGIFRRLATSDPGNAGWRRDLSVSYNKVGEVQEAQGDLKAALKSYSDSLAISDSLTKSDSTNAGWQRDRALSYGNLAGVHRQSGDKARARGYLRQGKEIMARLTRLSPDNAVWKQDLDWFDEQIKELGP
jgi:tetratricopeptide (TPR) repeat protein